jgi:endonuclease G
MKGYMRACFDGLWRKSGAAITIFAVLTTFFLFAPEQARAIANSGENFSLQQPTSPVVSNTVVISQFQAAGATANDEFIELHNTSTSTVDLNGLRLVYRSAVGTNDVLFAEWTTSTIIPAGGFYLIASNSYDGAVMPNFIYNSNACACGLSATSGGIAIRSGALNSGAIVDSVGYGSATNIFVETAATSSPAVNGSLARNGEGCTDTDNNSSDFAAINPSAPRGGSSSVNICSGGTPTLSINNVALTEGDSGAKTFSFTVSLSASVAENVTFDIATADGTATVADNDYGAKTLTGQTIFAGSQNYTYDVTVNGDSTIEPTETFFVSVTNVSGINVSDGTGVGTITTDDVTTSPTATGTASPSTVQSGETVLLTVAVNPGTNPTSSGITVSGNLSAIGGIVAQTFYDDGTNGDLTLGDNVFSYQTIVAAGTTNGTKNLPITVTDLQSRTANISIGLTIGTTGTGHSPEEHLIMGNPSNATTNVNNPFNYLMSKEQFALSYHRDRAIPNWVSWHLDSSWIGGSGRTGDFAPDSTLPAGWYQVTDASYSGTQGFDRGHHTPSGDRTTTATDNRATFLMTNMMPQAPGNNQGPWEKLESYSRTVVGQGNELHIIAGGIGMGGTGDSGFANTIDAGRVTVPAQTWKVIIILPVGENDAARVTSSTRTIGVIMPNDTNIRADGWQKYITTVDQVEALTGYDFFSNVNPAIQAQIESKLDAVNNTAPSATPQTKTTAEDVPVNIMLAATDANINNQMTYTIVNNPTNGTLSGTGADLIYTPNADYFGTDSFTFKASDGTADSTTVAVTLNVTAVNDAPVAAADVKNTSINTALTFAANELTANDNSGAINENGQTLTVSQVITTAQTRGTVILNGGQITFTPEANYSGAAAFDYQVCDNGTTNGSSNPKCATATVNVTVGEAGYTISGKISYGITAAGQPAQTVSGVNLNASGATAVSAVSDAAGNYQLSGLTSGGSYTVAPSKQAQSDASGINSLDATRIQQYLVGLITLTPNQLIAADTDGNGTVNSLDATRIQQRLVGIQTNNIIGQWKFLPASKQYNAVNGNLTGENYEAVLVGEVSGNWLSSANFSARDEIKEKLLPTDYQNKLIGKFEKELVPQIAGRVTICY